MSKSYAIQVSPEVLELLGPSLYTNIYYVLAELIANGYDADAKNVWIGISKDSIYVEDDGHGMSYKDNDIKKFLAVAQPSRSADENEVTTEFKRPRMGRKGVGKLAALSVSENVNVCSIKNGEKSGFVLTRHVPKNHLLDPIPESKITFEHINNHGTRIEMTSPEYDLPKLPNTVINNLAKFFPQVGNDFKIHVNINGKHATLIDSQKYISSKLDSLTVYGEGFNELIKSFRSSNSSEQFLKELDHTELPVELLDTKGVKREINLSVRGWIGTYKSTRGQKKISKIFQIIMWPYIHMEN